MRNISIAVVLVISFLLGCNYETPAERTEVMKSEVSLELAERGMEIDVSRLEQRIERSRTPGSDAYDCYLAFLQKKQEERTKRLVEVRKELQLPLNDETVDPAEALRKVNKDVFTAEELDIQEDELEGLRGRVKQIGLQKVERVRDDLFSVYDLMLHYELTSDEVGLTFEEAVEFHTHKVVEGLVDYTPINTSAGLFEGGEILEACFENRGYALEDLLGDLSRMNEEAPPDETELLEFAQRVWHWNFTSKELQVPQAQLEKWQEEAREIATRRAKLLLQKCRGVRNKDTLRKARELEELLMLVSPESVGTTAHEIAVLIEEEKRKLYRE